MAVRDQLSAIGRIRSLVLGARIPIETLLAKITYLPIIRELASAIMLYKSPEKLRI
jgi:hypothetical protein